jgi:hypothetical protein
MSTGPYREPGAVQMSGADLVKAAIEKKRRLEERLKAEVLINTKWLVSSLEANGFSTDIDEKDYIHISLGPDIVPYHVRFKANDNTISFVNILDNTIATYHDGQWVTPKKEIYTLDMFFKRLVDYIENR